MAGGIFINYRRALNRKDAQLLQKALQRHFGQRGVFLDVSGLNGGDHWLHVLEGQVDASGVMVSLIGRGWADAVDEKGNRRLDDSDDFVRFELARAFSRSMPVLPVLVDGAEMPDASRLPTNLLPLIFQQAMPLRGESLDDDADKIAQRLRHLIPQSRRRGLSYLSAGAGAAVALALGIAAGPMLLSWLRLPLPGVALPIDERLRADLERARDELEKAVRERDALRTDLAAIQKQLAATKTALVAALVALYVRKPKQEPGGPDPALAVKPGSGKSFRNCNDGCPEMVVVPKGRFWMGEGDSKREVEIKAPFAVGRFEVTFGEWEACVAGGGCTQRPDPGDEGWGRDRRPVINVSWYDAKAYVEWLSRKTGKAYRLLSEVEWEYAARAGTTTAYAWGDDVGKGNANCFNCGSQWDFRQTAPVGSFRPNAWGLHDMHGNVWEWCEDADGSRRVLRGGSWFEVPSYLRRSTNVPAHLANNVGFRLARTL